MGGEWILLGFQYEPVGVAIGEEALEIEDRPVGPAADETDAGQVRIAEVRPAQLASLESRLGEVAAAQIDAAQVAKDEGASPEVGVAEGAGRELQLLRLEGHPPGRCLEEAVVQYRPAEVAVLEFRRGEIETAQFALWK